MSKGIAGKNNWALFLLLLAGIVLGGFIGSLAAGVPFLSWLNYGQTFGFANPIVLDLGILVITFGVNGLMWPKPRRDIRPGCTASGQPKHSIEHHPIILWWPAGLSSWNQIFDPVPLGIGQLVSLCCHKITPMLFLLFYCIFGFCAIYI